MAIATDERRTVIDTVDAVRRRIPWIAWLAVITSLVTVWLLMLGLAEEITARPDTVTAPSQGLWLLDIVWLSPLWFLPLPVAALVATASADEDRRARLVGFCTRWTRGIGVAGLAFVVICCHPHVGTYDRSAAYLVIGAAVLSILPHAFDQTIRRRRAGVA